MKFKISAFFIITLSFIGRVAAIGENCTSNGDCLSTTNAICDLHTCKCDVMTYYSSEMNACMEYATEYKGFCKESEQCFFLSENYECKRNYCMCKENFQWFQGKCQPYVLKGQACNSKDDCYDGYDPLALDCINGVCSCSDGYYDRGLDCRRISSLGKSCAADIDCQSKLMNCTHGSCQEPNFFTYRYHPRAYYQLDANYPTPKNVRRVFDDDFNNDSFECQFDDHCINVANSQCVYGVCICKEGYYNNGDNCVKGISYCQDDSYCAKRNTFCFLNQSCVCMPGFFLSNDECIPEVGVADPDITSVQGCKIPGELQFVDGACYCFETWFTDDMNRRCIKTSSQQYPSCLSNEWCNVMGPYSYCNATYSTTGTCQCNSFAKLNTTTYICEKVTDQIPDGFCSRDNNCSYNQICRNERCQCVENFKLDENETCVPAIDGSCVDVPCSIIPNSKCAGGVCKCPGNSIFNDVSCLEMADYLNDPCELDMQCGNLAHAVCAGIENNKTCVCEHNYVEIEFNGDVFCMEEKEMGSPCMTRSDCTLVINRSFQCRNSICQCPVNHVLKNGYCVSSATDLLKDIFMFCLGFMVVWLLK